MNTTTYPAPVDKLLTIGKPEVVEVEDWPNYLELGLGPEHIPDLLRMLADTELLNESEEKPEGWAANHAMRVLGQLRDPAAVEPILNEADRLLGYDTGLGEWALEELPDVFGLIGPAAIPALTTFIADNSHDVYSRIMAANALEKMANLYPETREEVVTILTKQLESAQEFDTEVNASIIAVLINLKAVESAPVIEQAFAADNVDSSIVGDWDDVQVELGLKPREERTPISLFAGLGQTPTQDSPITPSSSSSTKSHKQAVGQKSKSKMAKQSRKKNRKKR